MLAIWHLYLNSSPPPQQHWREIAVQKKCEKYIFLTVRRKDSHFFHRLSHPEGFHPWQCKSSPTPYLVSWSRLDNDWQTLAVSPQVEEKFIISSVEQPSIRRGTALGSDSSNVPALLKEFLEAISHLELICQSADTQSTFCLQYSLSHPTWWGRAHGPHPQIMDGEWFLPQWRWCCSQQLTQTKTSSGQESIETKTTPRPLLDTKEKSQQDPARMPQSPRPHL